MIVTFVQTIYAKQSINFFSHLIIYQQLWNKELENICLKLQSIQIKKK